MPKHRALSLLVLSLAWSATACSPDRQPPAAGPAAPPSDQAGSASIAATAVPPRARAIIEAARVRTEMDETYDPRYYAIAYPGGDVPNDRGVCTDVVIRAYRSIGVDLQVLVHEDMRRHFKRYPKTWGLAAPDRNIDHRRVPNLETFLERNEAALPLSHEASDYKPGDLVTWRLPGNLPHIGIVSDRKVRWGDRPLILHNIGAGTAEDDIIFSYPITGHFRYYPGDA